MPYLMSSYNNNSPRYMRENHYAIHVHLKISQVPNYKISITLLKILIYIGKSFLNPLTNIHILIDNWKSKIINYKVYTKRYRFYAPYS